PPGCLYARSYLMRTFRWIPYEPDRVAPSRGAMKRLLLTGIACAALAACGTVPPPPAPPSAAQGPAPEFRAKDLAWSAERGSGAIRGEVRFRQGGTTFACSGQPVILTPDAPYSRWRITAQYGSADS